MGPLTITTLVLLTSIPTTFGLSGELNLLHRRQPIGCHDPKFRLPTGTFINFFSPYEPGFELSVYTEWTRYYSDAISAAAVLNGFMLSKHSGTNRTGFCGWQHVETVEVGGWQRGIIGYKDLFINGAQAAIKANLSMPLLHRLIEDSHLQQILPRAASESTRRPRNETLQIIHDILLNNAPTADMIVFLCQISLPILCTAIAVTLMISLMQWVTQRQRDSLRREQEFEDQDEGIELQVQSIDGRSVSTLGQNDLGNPIDDPEKPEFARLDSMKETHGVNRWFKTLTAEWKSSSTWAQPADTHSVE